MIESPLKNLTNAARLCLLVLILLGYGRLVWQLDDKDMWWDESLSLQRSEQALPALIDGTLLIKDGFRAVPTRDQHPFMFFLWQRLLLQLAGDSEFSLRYVSVIAATLMVPSLWALGRALARQQIFPATTGMWTAGLAAVNPFLLWYGQEARPYALWAWLTVFTTYLLWRCTESNRLPRRWMVAYLSLLVACITTHYFAMLMLPAHSILLYRWLAPRNRWLATAFATAPPILGAAVSLWVLGHAVSAGWGGNFNSVPLDIMIPDLLNAFSLGLSVDIVDVWRLDLVFGLLWLLGLIWSIRSWRSFRQGGWLLPLIILTPVIAFQILNGIKPAYMNARHISLIAGSMILLTGAGLAWLWSYQKWLTVVPLLFVIYGVGYSTVNYFTAPIFSKSDYTGLGSYLHETLLPGDLLLIYPRGSWRIAEYYLPVKSIEQAAEQGAHVATYNVPFFGPLPESKAKLQEMIAPYRRVWLVFNGTNINNEDKGEAVVGWLDEFKTHHARQKRFRNYYSILDLELYLPQPPVLPFDPAKPAYPNNAGVTFGEQIELLGYKVGQPLAADMAIPVDLYWRTLSKTDVHYKYILRLEVVDADGTVRLLAQSEREPHEGDIPTPWWTPDKVIVDYSSLPVPLEPITVTGSYRLTMQVYRLDTLEKQRVVLSQREMIETVEVFVDEDTVVLPYPR